MKLKKIIILTLVLLISFSCINNKKRPIKQESEFTSLNDTVKDKFYADINQNINKHSSKLNRLFKNRVISLGIENINLKTEKNILISLVHNVGTFDEINLITHDLNLNLIDSLYIGTTTMFDNGKSHTIKTEITKSNEIIFHHTDWGYINKEDIDTIKYEKNIFRIDSKGKIIKK